jgi:hypothetical protein
MEPMAGIEPATDGLRNRCSTAELHWRSKRQGNNIGEKWAIARNIRAAAAPITVGPTRQFITSIREIDSQQAVYA